jgi:predicted TPR repeat methyltransferase
VHGGNFPQAEAFALQVLERQPRNAEAYYILALSAMFQNRHAEMLPPIERAIANSPNDSQFAFVKGIALAALGRTDEAVASYRRALELRPDFFECWANLGNVLELSQRWQEGADAYARALRLRPKVVNVLNGFGICQLALGDFEAAVALFEFAVAGDPNFASAHNNLGNTLGRLGRIEPAIKHLQEAVRIRPEFTEAWINLGEQLYFAKRDAEAIAALDRALALEPGNAGLAHLRDSIAGVQTARAPDDFIRGLFDRFAGEFDKHLVENLEYRTPQRMVEFLRPWLTGKDMQLRIADLGCGTGLSGAALKPYAKTLVGVDLSGQMLAKARERRLYDALHEAEIARFLDAGPAGERDLASALDVFVYVGDLAEIFHAVARSLAGGGMFAFSVERHDGEDDFHLARSGRYAHSPRYIRALAQASGFTEWNAEETVIRKESGEPVKGYLFGFLRP